MEGRGKGNPKKESDDRKKTRKPPFQSVAGTSGVGRGSPPAAQADYGPPRRYRTQKSRENLQKSKLDKSTNPLEESGDFGAANQQLPMQYQTQSGAYGKRSDQSVRPKENVQRARSDSKPSGSSPMGSVSGGRSAYLYREDEEEPRLHPVQFPEKRSRSPMIYGSRSQQGLQTESANSKRPYGLPTDCSPYLEDESAQPYIVEYEKASKDCLKTILNLVAYLKGGSSSEKRFGESVKKLRLFSQSSKKSPEPNTGPKCPVVILTPSLPDGSRNDNSSQLNYQIQLAFENPSFFGLSYDDVDVVAKLVSDPPNDEENAEEIEDPSLDEVLSWDTKNVRTFDAAYQYLQITRTRRMDCINILMKQMDQISKEQKDNFKNGNNDLNLKYELAKKRNGITVSANCLYNAHFLFTTLRYLETTIRDAQLQLQCNSEVMKEFKILTDKMLSILPKVLSHICAPSAHSEEIYNATDTKLVTSVPKASATGGTANKNQACAMDDSGEGKSISSKLEKCQVSIMNIPRYGFSTESSDINGYAIKNFHKWIPTKLKGTPIEVEEESLDLSGKKSPGKKSPGRRSPLQVVKDMCSQTKKKSGSPEGLPLKSEDLPSAAGSDRKSDQSGFYPRLPDSGQKPKERPETSSDTAPLISPEDDQEDCHHYSDNEPAKAPTEVPDLLLSPCKSPSYQTERDRGLYFPQTVKLERNLRPPRETLEKGNSDTPDDLVKLQKSESDSDVGGAEQPKKKKEDKARF